MVELRSTKRRKYLRFLKGFDSCSRPEHTPSNSCCRCKTKFSDFVSMYVRGALVGVQTRDIVEKTPKAEYSGRCYVNSSTVKLKNCLMTICLLKICLLTIHLHTYLHKYIHKYLPTYKIFKVDNMSTDNFSTDNMSADNLSPYNLSTDNLSTDNLSTY
jgi:hypothetical protein